MPRLAFVLLALIAVGAAYAPVAFSGFVADDWPDLAYIANASLGDLLRDGLWGVEGGAGRYRPVLHLSAKLDWLVWGEAPFGYHLTHFLLHAGSGLLLAAVLARFTSRFVAGAAALVWLVHPLHPEAVSWFAARGNLLAVFWFLVAMLLLVQHRQGGRASPWRTIGAWLAALAAHLSHELVIFLPALAMILDLFVLGKGRSLPARVGRALQSLVFFGSALLVCLGLRVLLLEAAFGGELLEVLDLVPAGTGPGLFASALGERGRLLVAPVPPALLPAAARWAVFALTLMLLLAGAWRRSPRALLAALVPLGGALVLLWLPAAFVVIGGDAFVNTRMFYALLLPWALLLGLALARWRPLVRGALLAVLVLGYTALTFDHNRLRAVASEEAEVWVRAAQEAAAADPAAKTLHLLDPPLVREGILILENAVGAILQPPWMAPGRECHLMTSEMLRGLAVVPEKAELRAGRPRIVWRRDGAFASRALPPRLERVTDSFTGNELAVTRLTTLDVAGIRAEGTGLLVLEWRGEDGVRGEVPGWPLPAPGGVLFPVASDIDWLLAGTVVALRIRGGEVGQVEILDALPRLTVSSPADDHVVHRGAAPPTFLGEAAGLGPVARLTFLTWPGPLVLFVPLAGPRLELTPALTPDATGRFAWSVFVDTFLFASALHRMYWCLEEVDPLGRVVARSELRELVPRR